MTDSELLHQWRTWAQFVFGGGGELSGNDDELRRMVCERSALKPQVKDDFLASEMDRLAPEVYARVAAELGVNSQQTIWYPCACGAEHNEPTCPFGVPAQSTGQPDRSVAVDPVLRIGTEGSTRA